MAFVFDAFKHFRRMACHIQVADRNLNIADCGLREGRNFYLLIFHFGTGKCASLIQELDEGILDIYFCVGWIFNDSINRYRQIGNINFENPRLYLRYKLTGCVAQFAKSPNAQPDYAQYYACPNIHFPASLIFSNLLMRSFRESICL